MKTLIVIALMLGAILAGLLLLSYQPGDQSPGSDSDEKSHSTPSQQMLYNESIDEGESPRYPDPRPTDKSAKSEDVLPLEPPASRLDGAHIAIIMDDLGANLDTAEQVAKLEVPITMAIIPDLHHAQESMHIAAQYGREVMVHLPMEPLNYPQANPGDMALMLEMTEDEIKSRTAYYLRKLPLAKGCNNHMGSAFTQSPQQMTTVLEQISTQGFYFIDSLTSSNSIGAEQARKHHVPNATRDVFLDNERDVEKITKQLIKLLRIAQRNGTSIGICHPYPETITALEACASLADEYGVTVVPASKLVR
ncbi:MAG: divergent polysaccharide deacetylase family protein [Desulfuromonadaceae bacterium]